MKRALALILIFSGVACSIFRARVPPYPTGIVFPLAEAGRVTLDGKPIRTLVKDGGQVLFATDRGFVYCVDLATRKAVWTYAAGAPLGSPPALGNRSIAVWDLENNVHGVGLEGAPLWKARLSEPPASDLCPAKDRFYVGTKDGALLALDSATGEVLWTFRAQGAIEAGCAVWRDTIVLGSVDGRLYFLGPQGKLLGKFEAGAAIRSTPLVDGDRLYFGTDDGRFTCLDLPSRRRRWRMRTDGRVMSPVVADAKRVYFAASNTVLYAIAKSSGNIDWWVILPSRSPYRPELADRKVLAASSSPFLLCLDRRRGEEAGRYEADSEVRANPIWAAPSIFIADYDFNSGKGSLVDLRKQIKVDLGAAPPPPGSVGAQVALTASAVGFHLPKYEFFIRRDDAIVITQKESPRNTWTWYPDKVGKFTIGVKVRDVREERQAEITYEVPK